MTGVLPMLADDVLLAADGVTLVLPTAILTVIVGVLVYVSRTVLVLCTIRTSIVSVSDTCAESMVRNHSNSVYSSISVVPTVVENDPSATTSPLT